MNKLKFHRDRGKLNYKEFIAKNFGGEIVSDHLIKIDDHTATGEVFVLEKPQLRVVILDYVMHRDLEVDLMHEDIYDYTLHCYPVKCEYKRGEGLETTALDIPHGFVINQKEDILTVKMEENDKAQSVIFSFKNELISNEIIEVLTKIDRFAINIGDNRFIKWHKTFYNTKKEPFSEDLYNQWVTYKVHELFIYIQHIIYSNAHDNKNKAYHDFEIDIAMKIKEKIDQEKNFKPVLKTLAFEYGINSTKLGVVFKFITGHTIYQYYKLARILDVKEQITHTQKSFSEIAYEMGYTDVNHLSKEIKKAFNVSPTELRKSSQNNV